MQSHVQKGIHNIHTTHPLWVWQKRKQAIYETGLHIPIKKLHTNTILGSQLQKILKI